METLEENLVKIDTFASLEKGWDSYKASPIQEIARENAKKILRLCYEQDYPPSIVVPSVIGGVGLCWFKKDEKQTEAYIETYNKDLILLALCNDNTEEMIIEHVKVDAFVSETLPKIRSYLA